MSAATATLSVTSGGKTLELPALRLQFSAFQCFGADGSAAPRSCLEKLATYLIEKAADGLALYGTGAFFHALLDVAPDLASQVRCVIHAHGSDGVSATRGVSTVTPSRIPDDVRAVFLCETRYVARRQMRQSLPPNLEVIDADVLPDIAWDDVPESAWVPDTFNIYPIELPEIEFQSGMDVILIDCPARNLALMPNGLAYVYNALKRTKHSVQTVDIDIIVYHRYHMRRLFDEGGTVYLADGREMPVDPWQAEHFDLWVDPAVVGYFRNEIEEVVAKLIEARPRILGLSVQACNELIAREIVNGVKRALPDTQVIVGGFSCYNADIGRKAFPESDYMCIGEADLTVGPLVTRILSGERPSNIPGVLSRYDSPDYEYVQGPMPHNLDVIEFPKYEWVKLDLYRNFNNYQITPILASRGCRWSRCTFCAERFYWRIRSAEAFVDEVEWLMEQGCHLFMFNESDLNGMPEKLLEICDEIIRRKLPIKLAGQLRIHKKNDRAFFDKLKAAGFVALRFGVDAFSERTLRLQMKGYTTEMVSQNLKDCWEAGIYTEVNWVIGVPGETEEDIDEGVKLILKNKEYIGRLANINTLTLANGSVYWLDPDSHNIKFRGDRDEIYASNARAIPEDLWYSEGPYIDGPVRRARFRKIILALRDGGFNIGAWASRVVDLTLSAAEHDDGASPEQVVAAMASNAVEPAAIATGTAGAGA